DGAGNGTHAGVLVRDEAGFDPGAGNKQHAAVGIDVIDAVLGVVLGDKDSRLFPDGGLREEVDDTAESQVVVGNIGGAIGIAVAGAGVGGVIAGEADDDEGGQVA